LGIRRQLRGPAQIHPLQRRQDRLLLAKSKSSLLLERKDQAEHRRLQRRRAGALRRAYYVNDRGKWIFAGKDALEAQRFRSKLLDKYEVERTSGSRSAEPTPTPVKGTPLKQAIELWLSNLEAQGRDV
jgi:hypothetical protein